MDNSSLVRHMNEKDGNGRGKLFWGRSGSDGAPFRGPAAPMLREEEYDERAVRVGDPHVRIFKISPDHPEDTAAYQDVLTKVVNGGWGQVIHVDRQYKEKDGYWMIYMEWVQWYMEDGHPTAAHQQQLEAGPANDQQQQQPAGTPNGHFPFPPPPQTGQRP